MKTYVNNFWLRACLIVSVLYSLLFFPAGIYALGAVAGMMTAMAGLVVIWVFYFVKICRKSTRQQHKNKCMMKTTIIF